MTEAPDVECAAARAQLDLLVRRLRRLTPGAWATGEREERIRALAAALAVVGGDGRELPRVPTHALPDVVAVVGHDALDVEGAVPAVRALLLDALDATR